MKKTGKVTIKKGLKKGTYKVKVKIKANGNANYKASAFKTVTFKIKINYKGFNSLLYYFFFIGFYNLFFHIKFDSLFITILSSHDNPINATYAGNAYYNAATKKVKIIVK